MPTGPHAGRSARRPDLTPAIARAAGGDCAAATECYGGIAAAHLIRTCRPTAPTFALSLRPQAFALKPVALGIALSELVALSRRSQPSLSALALMALWPLCSELRRLQEPAG